MSRYCRGAGNREVFDDITSCRKGESSLEETCSKYKSRYGSDFITKLCTEDRRANPYYGSTGRHRHVEPTYREYPGQKIKANKDNRKS